MARQQNLWGSNAPWGLMNNVEEEEEENTVRISYLSFAKCIARLSRFLQFHNSNNRD
jgi:hypothetical protein